MRVIFVILISTLSIVANAQGKEFKTIMVLNLDTTQFFSNALKIDGFAELLNVKPDKIYKPYKNKISTVLKNYEELGYKFVILDDEESRKLHDLSRYLTIKNKVGLEYLAIGPKTTDQSYLNSLFTKYKADFYLSINLFEIIAERDKSKNIEKLNHVLHYDLFTSELESIDGGVFLGEALSIDPYDLEWIFKDFALEMIFKSYASFNPDKVEGYNQAISAFEMESFGRRDKMTLGFNLGFNTVYGGIGAEVGKNGKKNFSYNAGLGFDFSGFKIGAGVKYILPRLGRNLPFVAINYGFNSGNTFELGAAKDDLGNYIDPDNVSRHKIDLDHSLYLRTGIEFYSDDKFSIVPFIGFSYPFFRQEPNLVQGVDKPSRNNFVKFISPGGIGFGVILLTFW